MANKDPDEYIPIWNFKQGERQIIVISRMVYFPEEKEFESKKKMRQRMGSGKEIMARDLESKKKMEKFYLNPNFWLSDTREWTTKNKGFSIYRFQLPELISALQDIIDGKYDADMSSKISKLINPEVIQERPEEIQDQRPVQPAAQKYQTEQTDNGQKGVWGTGYGVPPVNVGEQIRPKYTEERYDEWFKRQSEEMQKELLEHEKLHPKETIYDAFYVNDE